MAPWFIDVDRPWNPPKSQQNKVSRNVSFPNCCLGVWSFFSGSPEVHNEFTAAHWKHCNLLSPCTWPKIENNFMILLFFFFFSVTFATVSLWCSHSYYISFYPVFSKVELMSLWSLILIFKWMMKKATAHWSVGQPWLYWQCLLSLQSRVWRCNPLFAATCQRGRAGIGLSFSIFICTILTFFSHYQRGLQVSLWLYCVIVIVVIASSPTLFSSISFVSWLSTHGFGLLLGDILWL